MYFSTPLTGTKGLHNVPMVLFICIRCCGLHRGLGTHISKPRSVDLDIWSPDSILLAQKWGNEKANEIWERQKPANIVPSDERVLVIFVIELRADECHRAIAEYIRAKYVEGCWLTEDDRRSFGLKERNANT